MDIMDIMNASYFGVARNLEQGVFMSGRGVLFALDDPRQDRLSDARGDAEVMTVIESIEEEWDRDWLFETDKGWDAIHRCLTDGRLEWDNGEFPLKLCILGGYHLLEGDHYVVSVTPDDQVPAVAEALKPITRERLRAMYDCIEDDDYHPGTSEEDFDYAWSMFEGMPEFWERAANAGRAVVFTVDM
ncbi:MAG: YfbM family protein [Planctomycetales bacterium]